MRSQFRAAIAALSVLVLLIAGCVCAVGQAGQDVQADGPSPKLVDLFVSGEGGYHTYRIPSIIVSQRGTLLAVCEGRKTSRADHGDVDMVCRRSTDGGQTWGPIRLIYEEGGDAKTTIGNPCPVVDQQTGTIWLPLTRDNDDVLLVASTDDGATWSKPRVITSSVKRDDWTWYATGPGNGIQLTRGPHRGRLVIPCDHRIASIADRRKSTRSHVIYSDDHGATWQIGGVTDFLMNECAVVELNDGALLLNMRSNRGLQRRGVATSTDGGLSWSPCTDADALVEPVCQASMIRYTWPENDQRSRLLFCNPASATARKELTLRISYDEGRTWPQRRLLYRGSSAYSSMAVLHSGAFADREAAEREVAAGEVAVVFERDDYAKITFARLDRRWLEQ